MGLEISTTFSIQNLYDSKERLILLLRAELSARDRK